MLRDLIRKSASKMDSLFSFLRKKMGKPYIHGDLSQIEDILKTFLQQREDNKLLIFLNISPTTCIAHGSFGKGSALEIESFLITTQIRKLQNESKIVVSHETELCYIVNKFNNEVTVSLLNISFN